MNLRLESYSTQSRRWPPSGRHILAQYDADSIVVYQAYRPEIGRFAAAHGWFGEGYSLSRMSWIKPNFLWMMFRCGWASKEGQQVVLAVRIRRIAFDGILAAAVASGFDPGIHSSEAAWKRAVGASDVRFQWDPDHAPGGAPQERRALQIGVRGDVLKRYSREWIVSIEDVSAFVREQHAHVAARRLGDLVTPREEVYPVADPAVLRSLGMASDP